MSTSTQAQRRLELVHAIPDWQPAAPPRAAHHESRLTALEPVLDGLAIVAAVWCSYWTYAALQIGRQAHYRAAQVWWSSLVFAAIFVLLMDRDQAYQPGNSLLRVRETERIIRISVISFGIAFFLTFLTTVLISRFVVAIAFVLVPSALALEKHSVQALVHHLRERDRNSRVLIYGAGYTGRRIFSLIARSPNLGFEVVGFVDDDRLKQGTSVYEYAYQRRRSAPVVAGPVTAELMGDRGADTLIVAIHTLDPTRFRNVLHEVTAAQCKLMFVPQTPVSDCVCHYADVDGMMLATYRPQRGRAVYEVTKRGFDLLFASLFVLSFAPAMAAIWAAIRLTTKGPAIFIQERVGLNGRMFSMYKFRTMYVGAAVYSISPKESRDPRITPFGRFLRRTSLDELPQLLNVVRGEMSLVGPRPEMPFIVQRYSEQQRRRLAVKPGITGLWQLSGDRAYPIHENIEYDLYYVNHRNFFMDVAVLFHTFVFAMRGI